jgi:hypothetical protein
MNRISSLRVGGLAVATFGLTAALGCAYPERGQTLERLEGDLGLNDINEGFDTPEMRMGTMPFDAWYSPLEPLGVEDLGDHAYIQSGLGLERLAETSRGTLYTTRAGFLDIAHIRNAMDLTRFTFAHLYPSWKQGKYQVDLLSSEPDVYHVTLTPPPDWTGQDPENLPPQVDESMREASIAIAGRLSYLMTTWHEVLTHFGYKGMGVITEKPSAFSFDDAASHRVGVVVAMQALGSIDDVEQFDEAATKALRDYLIELGAVSADEVVTRSEAVEGRFWDGDEPAFRVVDLGMDGHPLVARLTDDGPPIQWDWPPGETIGGHPISALFDVTIEMQTFEAGKILEALGKAEGPIHPRTDFPKLSEVLEAQLGSSAISMAAE